MAVKYKDYYDVLGVSRGATEDTGNLRASTTPTSIPATRPPRRSSRKSTRHIASALIRKNENNMTHSARTGNRGRNSGPRRTGDRTFMSSMEMLAKISADSAISLKACSVEGDVPAAGDLQGGAPTSKLRPRSRLKKRIAARPAAFPFVVRTASRG